MAVYKMDMEHLAQYLSDTKYQIKVRNATSTIGKRSNGYFSYPITICAITHQEITATADCFLDAKNNIQVRVYIPSYKYFVKTKELSYSDHRNELTFECKAAKKSFVYSIPNRSLHNFNDYEEVSEELLKAIEQTIAEDMNKFKGNELDEFWRFEGIKADISFIAYPSKSHEEHDYEEDFVR